MQCNIAVLYLYVYNPQHCPVYSDILSQAGESYIYEFRVALLTAFVIAGHSMKADSIDALQSELIALQDSVKK